MQLCGVHVCPGHAGHSSGRSERPHQVKSSRPFLVSGGRLQPVCLLFSAVLSSYLLGETLNILGKLGCLLCLLGSVLLVIHAPQEQEVASLQDMTSKLLEPGENRHLVA